MKKISIKTKITEYDVNFTDDIEKILNSFIDNVFIITDDNIYSEYSNTINRYKNYCIKPGEKSKTFDTVKIILEKLEEVNFQKTDILVAIGGGVVGDITGFVASVFKRGTRYIQIPTSLIGMVDSSIGGKTGINSDDSKNIYGTIYQPEQVLINTSFLNTLPAEEIVNGYGEIIKYALLDKDFFDFLISKKNIENLDEIIYKCINIKKKYVEKDEMDQNVRMKLNLGHTFGHCIEHNYYIKHGIAILYGIDIIIAKFGNGKTKNDLNKLLKLFDVNLDRKFDYKKLVEMVSNDKKIREGKLNLIIPISIGETKIVEFDLESLYDF